MADGSAGRRGANWRLPLVFAVFAAFALFLLLSENGAQALGLLPFLLLAACPVLHLFMHHGHGHEPGARGGR